LAFDLESYSCTSSFQAVYFEWLDIATSFSVWRYIFRILKSQLSFKVMGLISRSQLQNSGSVQVCAPLILLSGSSWIVQIPVWYIPS